MGFSIGIQTGLLFDRYALGREPSQQEKELGEWAASHGLLVHLSYYIGLDGEQVEYCDLGIEEFYEGKLIAYMQSMPERRSIWPEARDHMEMMLRAGLEREKHKHRTYPWWEQLSR